MTGFLRSRAALQAENLILRHQLNVLRHRSPKRVAVGNIDRLLFVGLYCIFPKALDALKILKPETVLRWHRAGFRAYWRWKSRSCVGRPKAPDACGHSSAHSQDKRCQPAVGSAAVSRRAAQALASMSARRP